MRLITKSKQLPATPLPPDRTPQRCLRRNLYLGNLTEALLEDGVSKRCYVSSKNPSPFATMTPITWDKSNGSEVRCTCKPGGKYLAEIEVWRMWVAMWPEGVR